MSGNYDEIRIRNNYTLVEAFKPTSNFVYFARSLTKGRRFCVSVGKVLNERSSDFSFIVGFTTCTPGSIARNPCHLTDHCTPTGCGGHSEQVKIFKANRIGALVVFERHRNREIYFAIDNSMPIHIQFDNNSSDHLARHEQLTPYIQLSGNVLLLTTEKDSIRKLNIDTAIAMCGQRNQSMAIATTFLPKIHNRLTNPHNILPVPEQAHQAFVALSDVDDIKFIKLRYPENDVKVSINQKAILRKNEEGERFYFYFDKTLKASAEVTVQVTKIYNVYKYFSSFEFGLMTYSSDDIKMNEEEFLSENVRRPSHRLKINRDAKVNDKFTFTRIGDGAIEVRKNNVVERVCKMDSKYQGIQNLLPFVILNGSVSGMIIINGTSGAVMEFGQMYEFPPIEFKMTANVTLTNQTLLTWNQNSKDGVIINAKYFDTALKFIIREVQTSTNSHSMTFGLINSSSIGFKTPREVSTCLDFKADNLIQSPALGLQFSLYKTPYGKVTLKCNDDLTCLFMVDPSQCYYPVFILDGSVVAIELLPNSIKKTITYMPSSSTVSSRTQFQSTAPTNDCKICMDRTINSVFVPCGHRFACYDCGKEWMENGNVAYGSNVSCPVCRKKIDTLIQTFD